jgi:hypothetical protein
MAQPGPRQALIESVKKVRAAGYERFLQQAPPAIRRQDLLPGSPQPVRAVAPQKTGIGVRRSKSVEQFAGINTHAGQIFIQAVGSVQRDGQSVI